MAMREFWVSAAPYVLALLMAAIGLMLHFGATQYYHPSNVVARSLDSGLPPSMPKKHIVPYPAEPFEEALWQEEGHPFHVFYGPHHCGKTVFVKRNLNKMQEKGRSVYYATANRHTEPLWTVREALGIPQQDPWLMLMLNTVGTAPRWPDTLENFGRLLATVAERRQGAAPLIVLDEVNAMKVDHAQDLVRFAKDQADHGAVHIVLMTSPGTQAQAVLAASASSRGELVLMPDPPKEAVAARLQKLKLPANDTEKVYELTGGRWEHLDRVPKHFRAGKFDFDDFKKTWIQAQRDRVARAAVRAKSQEEAVWALLGRVLREGPIKLADAEGDNEKQLEHRVAMACVTENLLLTVMTVQMTMKVDFHSPMVRAMVQGAPEVPSSNNSEEACEVPHKNEA